MLREICQGNQRGEQEEPVAKAARELWQVSSKTVRSAEWSEEDRVTPVQRQNLRSPESGPTKTGSLTVPRYEGGRTPWMLENTRVGI